MNSKAWKTCFIKVLSVDAISQRENNSDRKLWRILDKLEKFERKF